MTDQNMNDVKNEEKIMADFVDGLIKEKNSPLVNDQNREEIKNGLIRDLTEAINQKLVSQLTEEQVDELNKLLDAGAPDTDIEKYFADHIPNREELITQALTDFRNGYLSVIYTPEKIPEEKKMIIPSDLPDLSPAPVKN